jgi:hypothetical protein
MTLFNRIQRWFSSTDNVLTGLLQWTKRVGESRTTPLILQGGLAWTTVAVFSIRYLIDYLKLKRKMAQLRRYQASWWSYPIPLCPLVHTQAELDVSMEERWKRLCQALKEVLLHQDRKHGPGYHPNNKSDDLCENFRMNFRRILSWSDDKLLPTMA